MLQSIPVHFELNTCLSALQTRAFSASFEAEFLHKRSLRSQSMLQNTLKTILQNNTVKYSDFMTIRSTVLTKILA